MIDRLYDVLPYLEQLPPEAQEEAAGYIEALAEALEHEAFVHGRIRAEQFMMSQAHHELLCLAHFI